MSIHKEPNSNDNLMAGMFIDNHGYCAGFVLRHLNETVVAWETYVMPLGGPDKNSSSVNGWVSRVVRHGDVALIFGFFEFNARINECRIVSTGIGLQWFIAELDYNTSRCMRTRVQSNK